MRPGLKLILGSCGAGAAAGALAWLVFAPSFAEDAGLRALQARLKSPTASQAAETEPALAALGQPLFTPEDLAPPAASAEAPAEVPVRVEGVSLSNGRSAALLSVAGQPARWISAGGSASGLTVLRITPAGVTVRTAAGKTRDIGVGEKPAAAGPVSAAAQGDPL